MGEANLDQFQLAWVAACTGNTGCFWIHRGFKAKPMFTPIIRAGLVCAALKAVLVNEHSGLRPIWFPAFASDISSRGSSVEPVSGPCSSGSRSPEQTPGGQSACAAWESCGQGHRGWWAAWLPGSGHVGAGVLTQPLAGLGEAFSDLPRGA